MTPIDPPTAAPGPHYPSERVRMAILFVIGLAILIGAARVARYFIENPPTSEKRERPSLVPVVGVQPLIRGAHRIKISAMGTVVAAHEQALRPQAGGRVEFVHPLLREGGLIARGEELVRIEASDYEIAVARAASGVAIARAEVRLEEGRQTVARREWQMIAGADAEQGDSDLALRGPQLRSRKANLTAAEAALDQARLELKRTTIVAPMDALVIRTSVETGDIASPQQVLATLVGTEMFWVRVTVPVPDLAWIRFPAPGETHGGSEVRIHLMDGAVRLGHVLRLLGDIEPQGRMARLLVAIPDPIGRTDPHGKTQRPVLLGEHVELEILGAELHDVVILPRQGLRDGNALWLLTPQGTLAIRPLDLLWGDRNTVVTRERFPDGAQWIETDLSFPVDGMELMTQEQADAQIARPASAPGQSGKPGLSGPPDHSKREPK